MTDFFLSERAAGALDDILIHIAAEGGSRRAELVRLRFLRAFQYLAGHPGMGRERPDLTSRSHRFWIVHSYLVVYRADVEPLEVVDILHGSRGPSVFRDRVGEPVAHAYGSGVRVLSLEPTAGRAILRAPRLTFDVDGPERHSSEVETRSTDASVTSDLNSDSLAGLLACAGRTACGR